MADLNLKILQWNCRSLKHKITELQNLLSLQEIDIAALCETWINQSFLPKFRNFTLNTKNRTDGRGGVAILVRKGIPYSLLHLTNIPPEVEVIGIRVKNVNIINIYQPPNVISSTTSWHAVFSQIPQNEQLIIVGDFNSHHPCWHSSHTDQRGQQLYEALDLLNLVVLNQNDSTRLVAPYGEQSIVDLTITQPPLALYTNWSIIKDSMGSDHFPIVTEVGVSCFSRNVQDSIRKRKGIAHIDWIHFSTSLQDMLNKKENIPVSEGICEINATITNYLDSKHPKTRILNSRFRPPLWWDEDIKNNIKLRKELTSQYIKNMTPENYMLLNKQSAITKKLIRKKKRNSWKQYCNTLRKDTRSKEVWQIIKTLKNNRTFTDSTPLNWKTIEEIKQHICPLTVSVSPYTFQSDLSFSDHILLHPIEKGEIEIVLETVRSTSPGKDEITYDMIKHFPDEAFRLLIQHFNYILRTQEVPDAWKYILIKPILKANKTPEVPEHYRPISLLPCTRKLFEHILKNRLLNWLHRNHQMPRLQFGFQKNSSTYDCLAILLTDITLARNRGEITDLICLDLKAAYDNICTWYLFQQMEKIGIPSPIICIIGKLLSNRLVTIKSHLEDTEPREVNTGIPQGSVLSPLLFTLALQPLEKILTTHVRTVMYADDILIYKSDKSSQRLAFAIGTAIRDMEKWSYTSGLSINPTKSSHIRFNWTRNITEERYQVDKEVIPYKTSVKILGLIVDSKLSFTTHIQHIKSQILPRLNIIKCLTNTWWGADPGLLLLIYKTYIRPIMEYACFAFASTSKRNISELDTLQNTALRIALGLMKTTPIKSVLHTAAISPILHRFQFLTDKFIIKRTAIISHILLPKLKLLGRLARNSRKLFLNTPLVKSYQQVEIFVPNILKNKTHPSYTIPYLASFYKIPIHLNFLNIEHPITQNNSALYNSLFQEKLSAFIDYDHIYTDGSKQHSGAGAAFWIPSQNYYEIYKLPSETSIFLAEVMAIRQAILYYISGNNRRPNNKLIIFTDSLSLTLDLYTLKSNKDNWYLNNIRFLLWRARQQFLDITLAWIPGHSNIRDNEYVDHLAKRAVLSGKLLNILLPYNTYTPKLKLNLQTANQTWWLNQNLQSPTDLYTLENRWLHVPWFSKYKLKRNEIVLINRLRVNHTLNPEKLFLFKLTSNPYCHCGNRRPNNQHLFFECELNNGHREKMYEELQQKKIPLPTNLKTLLASANMDIISILIKFIRRSKIKV